FARTVEVVAHKAVEADVRRTVTRKQVKIGLNDLLRGKCFLDGDTFEAQVFSHCGVYSTCDPGEWTVTNATQQPSCSPLLTKEGWRDRASPIGLQETARRGGRSHETLRCERPPQLRFQRSIPSFVRRGFFAVVCYSALQNLLCLLRS